MKVGLCTMLIASVALLSACGGGGGGSSQSPALPQAGTISEQAISSDTSGREALADAGYALYVPEGYDPNSSETWPLIVFLHGSAPTAGVRKTFAQLRDDGLLYAISHGQLKPRAFVVAPLSAARTVGFDRFQVDAVIRDAQRRYPIDPHRVSLTGMSMGAISAWYLGMSYPNRFSAIAPVSGGLFDEVAARKTLDDGFWGNTLELLASTPVRVSHGTADATIPFAIGKHAADLLAAAGGDVDFRAYPTDHIGTAGSAFTQELADWLTSKSRAEPDTNHAPGMVSSKYSGDFVIFKGWLGQFDLTWTEGTEPGTMIASSPSWPTSSPRPVLVYAGANRLLDVNGELIRFEQLDPDTDKFQCIRFMYWTPILQTGERIGTHYTC